MRRLVIALVAFVLCAVVCAGLAEIPELDLSRMSAANLNQLQKDIEAENRLHHEMNSQTESGVKKAAESAVEAYYRDQGITVSWAWHGWEYQYQRDKDFFTFATHLDHKDSGGKNRQVKVSAELYWDGKEYVVYRILLDQQQVFALEGKIPEDHLVDSSNVVINEKTGMNLSLLSADELKELGKQVKAEITANHDVRNSGQVNNVLKKTVEEQLMKKGAQKVEWPWFDYAYTCDWNCYTETTRTTYELNGTKQKDVPVYGELFPSGGSYTVCYLKIGDEIVINTLDKVDSEEGKLFLNSRKYEQAQQLLAQGQYETAVSMFAELGDFDDSARMLGVSEDRNRQANYDEAALLMEAEKWDEAAAAFDSLGDYSDSAAMAEKCREAKRSEQYAAALALEGQGSLEQAIDAFTELSGYRDSDEKAEECREAIRESRYQLALEKMENGSYADAIVAFTELGAYRDCTEKIAACQESINRQAYDEAEALYAAGEYAKAAEAFVLLGDFEDSAERTEVVRGIVDSMDREISFAEEEYHLFPGQTAVMIPEITKTEETAPDDTVLVYSSGDPGIARVDKSGTVTAVKSGETVIHCEAADNGYIFADVTVHVEKAVNKVSLSAPKLDLSIPDQGGNGSAQLTVSLDPEDAYIQTGVWSSSNEAVATVDQDGHVTTTGAGKAVISFLSDDSSKGKKEAKCNVTVSQAVTAVTLNEFSGEVYVGKTFALKATLEPKNAANKKITWSSDDESVATVSANGQVKGVSVGRAVITATSADGPSASFYADVKIAPVTLKVSGTAKCVAKNHVGNQWYKWFYVNNEEVKGTASVKVENGDYIIVEWVIEEDDKNPDVGSYREKVLITPEIMTKGYKIEHTVWVTENGGRYSGNSAEWFVTVTIRP